MNVPVDVAIHFKLTGWKEKLSGLNLKAIRFIYRGKDPARRLETLPFYMDKIRGFLRQHLGSAVWLKGGIIEKPAYLIFHEHLSNKVKELLKEQLQEGGEFTITPVKDPVQVIVKYAKKERVAVGYLKLAELELGSPETLKPTTIEGIDFINGFMLKDGYTMIRAEDAELKMVERRVPGTDKIEKAPMLILTNAIETLLDKNGKIIGVDEKPKPKYGIWLELIKEKLPFEKAKREAIIVRDENE
jgi:hypothetical protein